MASRICVGGVNAPSTSPFPVLTPCPPLRSGEGELRGWIRTAENPGRWVLRDGHAQQVVSVATRQAHPGAAVEDDDGVAVEPRLHLPHPVQVDERGPADAA